MYKDPFDEIARMHEEMDRLFNRVFAGQVPLVGYGKEGRDITTTENRFRAPTTDVRETENNIIADIELPGADKKDIELNITDDSIEVKVEKSDEKKVEKKGVYSYSSTMTHFYRKVPLPKEVDADKAKASYKNGMLRIEAPKLKQVASKKRLQIE